MPYNFIFIYIYVCVIVCSIQCTDRRRRSRRLCAIWQRSSPHLPLKNVSDAASVGRLAEGRGTWVVRRLRVRSQWCIWHKQPSFLLRSRCLRCLRVAAFPWWRRVAGALPCSSWAEWPLTTQASTPAHPATPSRTLYLCTSYRVRKAQSHLLCACVRAWVHARVCVIETERQRRADNVKKMKTSLGTWRGIERTNAFSFFQVQTPVPTSWPRPRILLTQAFLSSSFYSV